MKNKFLKEIKKENYYYVCFGEVGSKKTEKDPINSKFHKINLNGPTIMIFSEDDLDFVCNTLFEMIDESKR